MITLLLDEMPITEVQQSGILEAEIEFGDGAEVEQTLLEDDPKRKSNMFVTFKYSCFLILR